MSHPADPQIFHTPPRLPPDQAFSSTTNLSDLSRPQIHLPHPFLVIFAKFLRIFFPRFKERKNERKGFFLPFFYGENFFFSERERESASLENSSSNSETIAFTLMRTDKILRIPERRSLTGCNAAVFHWLPPSVFDMCVYREIIGAP